MNCKNKRKHDIVKYYKESFLLFLQLISILVHIIYSTLYRFKLRMTEVSVETCF